MRGLSQTCGAVTGSFMVIGLKFGRIDANDLFSKEKTALLVEEFFIQFQKRHGSLICQQLIGYNFSIPEERKIVEQKGIVEQKCPQFVQSAAEILEEILTY
jgi:C_GCAxxG_C_C family probable redox protein